MMDMACAPSCSEAFSPNHCPLNLPFAAPFSDSSSHSVWSIDSIPATVLPGAPSSSVSVSLPHWCSPIEGCGTPGSGPTSCAATRFPNCCSVVCLAAKPVSPFVSVRQLRISNKRTSTKAIVIPHSLVIDNCIVLVLLALACASPGFSLQSPLSWKARPEGSSGLAASGQPVPSRSWACGGRSRLDASDLKSGPTDHASFSVSRRL